MTSIEAGMRQSVARALSDSIDITLRSYERFMELSNPGDDSKDFKAHHEACKAAIMHIELLIKLVQLVDSQDASKKSADDQAVLSKALADAKHEVERYRKTQK